MKNVIARKQVAKEKCLAHVPAPVKDGHRGTRPCQQLTKGLLFTLTVDQRGVSMYEPATKQASQCTAAPSYRHPSILARLHTGTPSYCQVNRCRSVRMPTWELARQKSCAKFRQAPRISENAYSRYRRADSPGVRNSEGQRRRGVLARESPCRAEGLFGVKSRAHEDILRDAGEAGRARDGDSLGTRWTKATDA